VHRPLEHRVEDRGEITGGGIDDLQYLGGCGLLLSGIDKFALERIAFGGPLIKLAFALGKLALEISDNLVRVG
jgi:hypothetical protein